MSTGSSWLIRSGNSARAPALAALALLALLGRPLPAHAQDDLQGTWRGDLTTPAGPLTLVVSLDGGPTGTVAVPSRGVSGIPVTRVTVGEEGTVTFRVPADGAAFEGRLEGDGKMVGEWIQAGRRIPLELERVGEAGEEPAPRARPQTPEPPYPYVAEDVVVEGGERLACTRTRPRSRDGPVPGAVLLTVAGPNDRDQTHSGHRPYLVLADHLTRHGVATLRCDDRGVGGSGGDLFRATVEDLTTDALAMVRHLASLEDIGSVGVIGNSEGSVVGARAAAEAPEKVAFAILLGGVGVRGAELIRARLVARQVAGGRSQEEAEEAVAVFDALADAVREAGGVGAEELRRTRPDVYARLARIAREAGTEDPFLPRDPEARLELFAGPWYHAQLTLDGGEILERVRVPVLALTGSKDRVNLPDQNLPAIRAALGRAGNPDARVEEVPGLNHVFQTAEAGGMAEYPRLEESFAPVALERITEWILTRFAASDGDAARRRRSREPEPAGRSPPRGGLTGGSPDGAQPEPDSSSDSPSSATRATA